MLFCLIRFGWANLIPLFLCGVWFDLVWFRFAEILWFFFVLFWRVLLGLVLVRSCFFFFIRLFCFVSRLVVSVLL